MQPVVSVIIPTYNRANWLKKSVQSVLDQTLNNIEIIIINNYSIDDTLETINAFNDNRIRIINFKNEGIIARSRNQGIIQSSGKYIAFLDDDDLWCPDKLELQVNYIESHPEFDLVYSDALIIDGNENRKDLLINPNLAKEGDIFLDLLFRNFIPNITILMKREIIELVGLINEDKSIMSAEDYEYWLRASLKSKFGYINRPLALYRVHDENVSSTLIRPLLWQRVFTRLLNNPDVPEEYYNKINYHIERFNADVSVYYWSNSDRKTARLYAKKYVFFNLKKIRLLNVPVGFLLYVSEYFDYNLFNKIIEFATRIRKPLGF